VRRACGCEQLEIPPRERPQVNPVPDTTATATVATHPRSNSWARRQANHRQARNSDRVRPNTPLPAERVRLARGNCSTCGGARTREVRCEQSSPSRSRPYHPRNISKRSECGANRPSGQPFTSRPAIPPAITKRRAKAPELARQPLPIAQSTSHRVFGLLAHVRCSSTTARSRLTSECDPCLALFNRSTCIVPPWNGSTPLSTLPKAVLRTPTNGRPRCFAVAAAPR
jgi:hypothetical protein